MSARFVTILHDEAEIEAWLKKAGATLKEKVKQGPVIIS